MKSSEPLVIRPYTLKDLARLYDVHIKVIRGWLKMHDKYIGRRKGHYYTSLQVQVIFDRLGPP